MLKNYLFNFISKLKTYSQYLLQQNYYLNVKLSNIHEALGRIEKRQLETINSNNIFQNEFRVFSQFGEDGIIQFLLRHIPIQNKVFVEFGVENYTEANTRFLLVNDNWSGLVVDGSKKNIEYIKKDRISWLHNLKAIQAFITRENINVLLSENGVTGDIGILSIDIDGNDYWVWEAITIVNPVIVIVEYNHRFGRDRAVTIPYNSKFVRAAAHYSNIYFGASLKAFCLLAAKKGYAFVGCCSAGINAFFVRKDMLPEAIPELTVEQGFVSAKYRESRDEHGHLNFLSPKEEQKILEDLPLTELD